MKEKGTLKNILLHTNYSEATPVELVYYALKKSEEDGIELYTQNDIIEAIAKLGNGAPTLSQGAISKAIAKINKNDTIIKNKKITVIRGSDNESDELADEDAPKKYWLKKEKIIVAVPDHKKKLDELRCLFDKPIFHDSPNDLKNISFFVFNIKQKSHAKAKELLNDVLDENAYSRYISYKDNLVLLMNLHNDARKPDAIKLAKYLK